jgi:hypothetical protein
VDLREWMVTDHASVWTRIEAAVLPHIPQERWRERAGGSASSIAWLLFHRAYHEDLALRTAVRNHPPLLTEHRTALGIDGFAPPVGLGEAEVPALTADLRLDALLDYVHAVHEHTQGWLARTGMLALDTIPQTGYRLTTHAGVTPDEVPWLHAMWADKPVSWFVMWECIGHGHAHVGEMLAVRSQLGLSPF